MTKWSVKERAIDAMSHMLDQGGMEMSDWFSDKLYKNIDFIIILKLKFLCKKIISIFLPVHGV